MVNSRSLFLWERAWRMLGRAWSSKHGASQKTIANYLNHIRKFYQFLISEGVVKENPVAHIKVQGIKEADASLIHHTIRDQGFVDEQFSLLNKVNGTIISFWDESYPAHLKNIYDPPALLFVRGKLHYNDNFSIAQMHQE